MSIFLPLLAVLVSTVAGVQNETFRLTRELLGASTGEIPPGEYDFIIIGGGSAGAVVANRLTEIEKWKVLLLEAGGSETYSSDIPLMAPYQQLTNLDWQYQTVPQEGACLGMVDQKSNWPRGKVLGGSSVLNYMLYVRGNRRDYDTWAALGNPGWSYEDVLPYFKKSEDNNNPVYAKTVYHSTGGYLSVSDSPYATPMLDVFLQAGKEMGYHEVDINGETQTGLSKAQGTMRNGSRCSTARAFLEPVLSRENLVIASFAHVTKILIDSETKTAYGVEFNRNGTLQRINATKEVILSAGTVNSPQILMLSGVGPAEELAKHNIPVLQDLKVGHNLIDHITHGGFNFLINTTDAITLDEVNSTVIRFLKCKLLSNGKNGPDSKRGGPTGHCVLKRARSGPIGPPVATLGVLVSTVAGLRNETLKLTKELLDASTGEIPAKEYDFIIIGGGSAGAVLANRLTEMEKWNVLLLEAGGSETYYSDIPFMAPNLQLTDLDWQYQTVPQEGACLAMIDQKSNWPRGKVLGGSSVLNYMLYVRGNRRDYDTWAALGNPGWSYEDVLPYFKKSEDNNNPAYVNTVYHSTGGYLSVSDSPYATPMLNVFLEAGKEMGYDEVDINGETQTGFGKAQGTTRNGSRCSTARAFLEPVLSRENLVIASFAHVTKILIDSETKTAYGVEFNRNGTLQRINATKEVILSAGAVNSPQILMLSGVGPADELAKHKIPVLQDLKVGYNLMDHIAHGGFNFMINTTDAITLDEVNSTDAITNYTTNGTGVLTMKAGTEGFAFVTTKFANSSDDYPDTQFHFATIGPNFSGSRGQLIADFYEKTYAPFNYRNTISIVPVLLRPQSRGVITLKSNNPYDHPIIDPKYFKEDIDMRTLIEGVKIGFEVFNTKAFKSYGATFIRYPDCANFTEFSDEYWECTIRLFSQTLWHPIGTCKMGPTSDKSAVVDPQLRLHGIKRLRVIDASIFPGTVNGNTNAATIMTAEKGSDLIKQTWQA